MSAMQRDKGGRGEREFFALLSDELGTVVRRNIGQARAGGADGTEVPGWAIEVKRHEGGFRQAWWDQAVAQARKAGALPALAYRASRQPWRVRLWIEAINDFYLPGYCVEVDLPTFAMIVRESL